MTDSELAWAAGFFEGEGTVRITKPTFRNWGSVIVSIVNTDPESIEFFQQRWPGSLRPASGLHGNCRPAWVWVIPARRAAVFLRAIRPFIVRSRVRERIDYALQFQDQKRSDTHTMSEEEREAYRQVQWESHWWMAELNKRGRAAMEGPAAIVPRAPLEARGLGDSA